jgi:hypothetical protein
LDFVEVKQSDPSTLEFRGGDIPVSAKYGKVKKSYNSFI